MTTKTAIDARVERRTPTPPEMIGAAAAAFADTCLQQMDLPLEPRGEPREWNPRRGQRGSLIELRDGSGAWTLAVACNELTAMVLTRILFAMEIEDLPSETDVTDALGELINVAGGLFKASGDDFRKEMKLGLPGFFADSRSGLDPAGSPIVAQRMATPDELAIEVILARRED